MRVDMCEIDLGNTKAYPGGIVRTQGGIESAEENWDVTSYAS
jgi:hypothetical protein